MRLIQRVVAIHDALDGAAIPHAFGGALALAWCTQRARGTIDIDVNIFVNSGEAAAALEALPDGVEITESNEAEVASDGQTRLWWDRTPVDVFFNTTEYHREVAGRAQAEELAGHSLPFLACNDLAVFKAFFNRTRDWADLEDMIGARTIDLTAVLGVLTLYLGGEDDRITRLRELA